MNKDEKTSQYENFVSSEEFTRSSYGFLTAFRENIHTMIHLAELHAIFIRRVESGDVKHNFPEPVIAMLKQMIAVDLLSKIMTMIESILVLFDTFSTTSRKNIPYHMVKYNQATIDAFIRRLQNDFVNLWRLAGFPNLTFLQRNCGLNDDEIALTHEILDDSTQYLREEITRLADFYQSNRIIHRRYTNGLLFQCGFPPANLSTNAPEDLSLFLTFDRMTKKPQKVCIEDESPPKEFDWFNVYSLLPYSNSTIQKYSDIMKRIRDLSDHIVGNHLLWGQNCGEDYLPLKETNGELFVSILCKKGFTEEQNELFKGICAKVYENINVVNIPFHVNLNYDQEKTEKLLKCLSEDKCATIWHPLRDPE